MEPWDETMTGQEDGPGTTAPDTGDAGPAPPPSDGPEGPYPLAPEGGTVSLDVERLFPEIRRLKVTGCIMFAVAGLTAVMPMVLLGDGLQVSPVLLAGTGLAATGVAVGIAGLASPALRRASLLASPVLLVAAAAVGTPGASLDSIPPLELALALAFGASWILALEHLHALGRFVELGAYVARQRLTSFRLSGVVNHFQVYGAGLVGLILAVTAVVVVGVPWVFARGSSDTLARSVELNTVMGVAVAAAVVFTLSALILVFVRSVMPQRVEVERVAYSKERMDDMLRSSKLIETEEEG